MPSSRGSSQSRNWTQVSLIAGRYFTIWATREAPCHQRSPFKLRVLKTLPGEVLRGDLGTVKLMVNLELFSYLLLFLLCSFLWAIRTRPRVIKAISLSLSSSHTHFFFSFWFLVVEEWVIYYLSTTIAWFNFSSSFLDLI